MDGAEHAHTSQDDEPGFHCGLYGSLLVFYESFIIRQRVAACSETSEIDLSTEEARKITFDVAAEALTGLKAGPEVHYFRELFLRILMLPRVATSEEDFDQQLTQLKGELRSLLLPKIEERRRYPTDDIFGMLVEARD